MCVVSLFSHCNNTHTHTHLFILSGDMLGETIFDSGHLMWRGCFQRPFFDTWTTAAAGILSSSSGPCSFFFLVGNILQHIF